MEEIGVLFNICYGGFGFSNEFKEEYKKRTGKEPDYNRYSFERHDEEAVKLFLEKGSDWSSAEYAKIDILYIPKGMIKYYRVSEYDGNERVILHIHKAIVDKTKEYIGNPTPEKLEWLKQEIDIIESHTIRYDD